MTGWARPRTEWPQRGWINIGLISNHDFVDFGSWRGKLRRIAQVLHAETYPFLEFYCREDVAAVVVPSRSQPMRHCLPRSAAPSIVGGGSLSGLRPQWHHSITI